MARILHPQLSWAAGGAKTDSGNYNGMNWSGLQWQIDRYHPANDPSHSLIVIWCGVNDLIEADANPGQSAQNIINAIDGLTEKGARHLVILTLPDITLAPAYNDQSLPDYAHYAAIKEQVKNQIYSFNQRLVFLVNLKKESVKHNGSHINIQLIDFSNFLNQQTGNYKNTTQPWLGTYQYPDPKRWMWWDAWHPMTDVHKNISGHLIKELRKIGYQFGSK